jgi:hypothetical protein
MGLDPQHCPYGYGSGSGRPKKTFLSRNTGFETPES